MSWLADRVASTKTIGNSPIRKEPRRLLGTGLRSEERCVMVMDMVREIGQPSPDGVEIRVHLENLVNFYYKETGVCLLGKIFSFEQYVGEMQHRDFARFWRVMFDSPPGKDTLVFIVVPAVGLYPAPDPADAGDSSTVDDSYEGQLVEQAEEVNTAETVPAQAPRISPAGLRIISNTVRSVVNSNLRDCGRRGNDMPCNRLPMSREDLHARRVTPPPEEAPYEEKEAPVLEYVAPAAVKPNEQLEERHLEWMKKAKVIENVRVEGANLFASMRFVPPRSMLLTALWGNHNYERFNFIENQLRAFAESVNLTPVSILHLGQEYVTRSEGRLGRAIFVKQCDGDLFSFVLLDYHAHVKVPRSCVFEMPSIFSSSSLPSNTFLATIRGIESIPTSCYEALYGVITPEDGSLAPELQIGEIFNIDQGETRLADWICALNTDLWFSDCCLQEGAIPTVAAPKKVSFELLRKSFLKQKAGFTFDPEMEVIVFRTPSVMGSENANSISQISSQLESLQIGKNTDENGTSVQGNKRAVRFSDQPDDLFHCTLEAETGSQNSTASSILIHDEASVESNPGEFSVRVRSLLKFFFVLHNGGKMIDRPFDVKKFTFTVFQSMVKDPLDRQYALSKFAAVLHHYKSLWMDPSDQHSLDIVASTVNDWISADL